MTGHFVLLYADHVPVQAPKYANRLFSTSFGFSLDHLKRTEIESIAVFEVVAEGLELLFEVDRDVFKRAGRQG